VIDFVKNNWTKNEFFLDLCIHFHNFFPKFEKQFNLNFIYTPNKIYLMRWTIKPNPIPKVKTHLPDVLNIDALIATLLLQRGIETFEQARQFFRPTLDDLHNPYLMKDMDKAVERIEKAIENQENILVFGDYDVDGTTAVSLVSSYLKNHLSKRCYLHSRSL
jgi:hypothetical protein